MTEARFIRATSSRQLITRLYGGPGTAVARGHVDEVRLKVHVGVVRQRVVLWDILERTRCLVVDRDVDGGRS